MMLGPPNRVMMIRQPFCAKKTCIIHTFCVHHLVPPAQFHIFYWPEQYCDPTEPHNDLTPPQVYRNHATASCSETIAPQVFRNYGTAHWFYRTVRCHSFCTPVVVLNRCAILLDHNNTWFSCKYRTARVGLNFAQKKCEVCMCFAQNGCMTINILPRGPNIII